MASNPRPIAALTISFGLVAIPVKLYSATLPSGRVSFNLVRASDGSRVKQQYIAVKDGKLVERSEMAKGFEFAKEQYVVFSAGDLKALEEMTTHSIDIEQFVPLDTVDPVYFDGTYYLAPDKGGNKPYALLAHALVETRQCGVGRWVSRGKEHVVVIRPLGKGLALHQLHFEEEVRDIKDVGVGEGDVSAAELKLAEQLIAHLSAQRFDPHVYHDEFKERVDAAIKRKVAGKEVALAEAPVPKADNVVDLMAALQASLGGRAKEHSGERRKAPRRAAAPATRRAAKR